MLYKFMSVLHDMLFQQLVTDSMSYPVLVFGLEAKA